ncbi:MAG: metallophosphoesterase family protein [Desulfatitalea sp.]|nr:metallophosphatase family protein [Desulfatitalea sp.]NNJ99258.1 metallophosphoesterase family protein [Desulfatitalea sp.]
MIRKKVVGVLSDTHGRLANNVIHALQDVDYIIHAGDIGDPQIVTDLARIAPLTAVRGNTDAAAWATALPLETLVTIDPFIFFVLHDLMCIDLDPVSAGMHAVISGHTHQPDNTMRNGVLYFNPGSASRGRHGSPPSIGKIYLNDNQMVPDIIVL